MLPNRRQLANRCLDFIGYILPFNPNEYKNKTKIRKLLGYSNEPSIICSIGGTSAGKDLLDLCKKACPIIKKEFQICKWHWYADRGLSSESIQPVGGITVKGYVPELYKHLAAADLAIVSGGGTITLELTALPKPFIYFPLKQHFEQIGAVAQRCERQKAGFKMDYSKTTPEFLAKQAQNIGKTANYPPIPTDGAKKAAETISNILNNKS